MLRQRACFSGFEKSQLQKPGSQVRKTQVRFNQESHLMSSGRGEALGHCTPGRRGRPHDPHPCPSPTPTSGPEFCLLTPFMPTGCLGPGRSGTLRILGSGGHWFLTHDAQPLQHVIPKRGDAWHVQLGRDTGGWDLGACPWGQTRRRAKCPQKPSVDRKNTPSSRRPHTSTQVALRPHRLFTRAL